MALRKFKVLIVLVFLGIFSGKMIISIAPAFSINLDKSVVNSVIMQLEVEQNAEKDTGKSADKLLESKLYSNFPVSQFKAKNDDIHLHNSFFEHSKRYVNPYHPSVPTPPPNFS